MDTAQRLARPFSSQLATTLSLDNSRLFWVVLLLSVAPLWFSPYLPAVDLAQHAGHVAALKEVLAGNETFTRLFEINWFTPYLIAYLLLYALSYVLPMAVAMQLLVTFAVLTTPICAGALLRAAGADQRWKWLVIPGSYSFGLYWGFLTFIVAVPLGLLFLVQTWRFVQQPTVGKALLIALTSVLLFFCHLIVLCVVSLFALGIVAGGSYRNVKQLIIRSLPFAAPLPLIALWWMGTYEQDGAGQGARAVYEPLYQKLMQLLIQPSGLDYFSWLVAPVAILTIALLPALTGATPSRRPERWLPFALGLLVFLALPAAAFNVGFLYQRMGIFVVPLWLMAWDAPQQRSTRWDWIAMVVVIVCLFANVGRFAAFAREAQSFDRVLSAATPGKKMGYLMNGAGTPLFSPPVYLHFPAWYQATRGGIVDFNFADFPLMVRYKRNAPPRISELVAVDLRHFQWEAHGGDNYDYFLVRSPRDIGEPLFREHSPQIELVTHSGPWWLYRNTARPR